VIPHQLKRYCKSGHTIYNIPIIKVSKICCYQPINMMALAQNFQILIQIGLCVSFIFQLIKDNLNSFLRFFLIQMWKSSTTSFFFFIISLPYHVWPTKVRQFTILIIFHLLINHLTASTFPPCLISIYILINILTALSSFISFMPLSFLISVVFGFYTYL